LPHPPQRAVVGAAARILIPQNQRNRASQPRECVRCAIHVIDVVRGALEDAPIFEDLLLHSRGFEAPQPAKPPLRRRHFLHQMPLRQGPRIEFVEVAVEQRLEIFGGFAGKHQRLRDRLIPQRILRFGRLDTPRPRGLGLS
jgi:hypothetical protein